MKKLLALILCVMMFVAVIPTSAFAATATKTITSPSSTTTNTYGAEIDDTTGEYKSSGKLATWTIAGYPTINNPIHSVASYEKEIKDMIKNTRDNIQTAYGILIGDQVVYTSAKTMDDTIVDLVDALTKKLVDEHKTLPTFAGGTITFTKAVVNNIKNQVRYLIDDMVADEMAKTWKYTDGDGKVDPIKYAQVFNKAVSDALTNKKFMKGYEAVATWAALWALCGDINDELDKQYEAFYDSVDKKFDSNFTLYYPQLWTTYVDTFYDEAQFIDLFKTLGMTDAEAAVAAQEAIDDPWANVGYAFVSMS